MSECCGVVVDRGRATSLWVAALREKGSGATTGSDCIYLQRGAQREMEDGGEMGESLIVGTREPSKK